MAQGPQTDLLAGIGSGIANLFLLKDPAVYIQHVDGNFPVLQSFQVQIDGTVGRIRIYGNLLQGELVAGSGNIRPQIEIVDGSSLPDSIVVGIIKGQFDFRYQHLRR